MQDWIQNNLVPDRLPLALPAPPAGRGGMESTYQGVREKHKVNISKEWKHVLFQILCLQHHHQRLWTQNKIPGQKPSLCTSFGCIIGFNHKSCDKSLARTRGYVTCTTSRQLLSSSEPSPAERLRRKNVDANRQSVWLQLLRTPSAGQGLRPRDGQDAVTSPEHHSLQVWPNHHCVRASDFHL